MECVIADFVIIGAGAVGLASALELARRGARVTVLDKGQSGAESTWAGGGILSPLLPWMYGDAVNALSEYSRALFPTWIERLQALSGLDAEYRVSGMCVLPPFDGEAALAWCAQHGWRGELRDSAALLSGRDTAETALWLPQVAQARNPRLAKVLRGAALASGVRIVESAAVTGWVTHGGRVQKVSSQQGDFGAEAFVIAAGAWSGVLGDLLGDLQAGEKSLAERIYPVRGQMLLFKLPPELLSYRLPCIVLQHGAYLIPRADGHVLAGSTLEYAGFDKATTVTAKQDLMAFAAGILPELNESTLRMQWSGLRPGSPENVPLIAAVPAYENLYLNSGHFRYGVTMAAGSAQVLADLIAGKSPAIAAEPYAFEPYLSKPYLAQPCHV
jgi:glycine oxidase